MKMYITDKGTIAEYRGMDNTKEVKVISGIYDLLLIHREQLEELDYLDYGYEVESNKEDYEDLLDDLFEDGQDELIEKFLEEIAEKDCNGIISVRDIETEIGTTINVTAQIVGEKDDLMIRYIIAI